MQLNNPRQVARELCKASIPNDLWVQNHKFVVDYRHQLQQHPIAKHPVIDLLNQGTFNRDAMRKIHLEYRHAIVQTFTDALLMAQVQSRQIEQRLAPGSKMYARFLLTLNSLDEFGFKPGVGQDGYYRGNPLGAHYPLYEQVLDEFGVSFHDRSSYVASSQSGQVRNFLEQSYDDFASVVALLAVAERVVVLFSAPLRSNTKVVGVDISKGYYINHGASDDTEAQADDDTHEDDLWYVLMQAISPNEYEKITQLCERYCELWVNFWNVQMLNLRQPVRKKATATV